MADEFTGPWFVVSDDGVVRKSAQFSADGRSARVRVEMYGSEALLDQIAAERSVMQGKGWQDGKPIGRVPLAHYFASGLAEAAKQRDTAFIKRFWNDGENRRLRLFEGTI